MGVATGREADVGGRTVGETVSGRASLTLAEEHLLLMGQVTRRAQAVLAQAAAGRWPAREARALLGYLRAEVLRQASDEEWLLFPDHAGVPEFTRLARDHARLHAAVEALAQAAPGEGQPGLARLAVLTRDLLAMLGQHLHAEEALLAAGTAPATSALSGRPHRWYTLTEGPVIDLDALPDDERVEATVDRLLRLRRGEHVELRSARDPFAVWRRLDQLDPRGFGFAYLAEGPKQWRVQVTRRPDQ